MFAALDAANQFDPGQTVGLSQRVLETAVEAARAAGERVGGPGGFVVAALVDEAKSEARGHLCLVVLHAVVDEALDAGRAQDIAEGLAQLGLLAGLHGGVARDAVDAVFGELDFPGVRVVWIVLAQPAGEDAEIAKGDARPVHGAKIRAEQARRVGVPGDAPVAAADLGDEMAEEGLGGDDRLGVREHRVKGAAEVVLERDEDLGVRLLLFHGVVGGVVALRVDAGPGGGVAGARGAAVVEPLAGVDFVVDDEIGDAAVAIEAVEIPGKETGKAPVVSGACLGRRAEVSGHHRAAVARSARPGGNAVDDASHDHARVCVGLDGGGVARFDAETIAVVFDLA